MPAMTLGNPAVVPPMVLFEPLTTVMPFPTASTPVEGRTDGAP